MLKQRPDLTPVCLLCLVVSKQKPANRLLIFVSRFCRYFSMSSMQSTPSALLSMREKLHRRNSDEIGQYRRQKCQFRPKSTIPATKNAVPVAKMCNHIFTTRKRSCDPPCRGSTFRSCPRNPCWCLRDIHCRQGRPSDLPDRKVWRSDRASCSRR